MHLNLKSAFSNASSESTRESGDRRFGHVTLLRPSGQVDLVIRHRQGELRTLTDRLREIEGQIHGTDRAIEEFRPLTLKITTEMIRERVISSVMQLRAVVAASDPTAAKNALRRHIGCLVLTPAVQDGRRLFKVSGSVNLALPDQDKGGMLLVARDGIGTPTVVDCS